MIPVQVLARRGRVAPLAGRRRRAGGAGALALAAASFALGSVLVAAPASAGAHLVQPPGATFAAAFPGEPRPQTVDPSALRLFPGATSAAAYWVSPDTGNLLARTAPVPHAPTYLVATARYPTSVAAIADVNALAHGHLGLTRTTAAGISGFGFVGREASPINKGSRVTQPKAFESFAVVPQGEDVYIAIAISARRGPAVAFTRSLRLAAPGSSALPTGSGVVPAAAPVAAAGSGSASHQLRDGAIVVVGLALIALGLAFRRQGSISLGHRKKTDPAPRTEPTAAPDAPAETQLVAASTPPAAAVGLPVGSLLEAPAEPAAMAMAVATTSSRTVLPQPPPPPVPAPHPVPTAGVADSAGPATPSEPAAPPPPARTPLSEYIGTPDILPGR